MPFEFGKLIDYGKSHPKGTKFPHKRAWFESRDRFGGKATLFKFRKGIDYGKCHTRG